MDTSGQRYNFNFGLERFEIAHNLRTVSHRPIVWKLPVVWNHTLSDTSISFPPHPSGKGPSGYSSKLHVRKSSIQRHCCHPKFTITGNHSIRNFVYRIASLRYLSIRPEFSIFWNSSLFDTAPSARITLSGIHPSPDQFENQNGHSYHSPSKNTARLVEHPPIRYNHPSCVSPSSIEFRRPIKLPPV